MLHGSKQKKLLIELSSTNAKLSIETLVGELITVGIEKNELDYQTGQKKLNSS